MSLIIDVDTMEGPVEWWVENGKSVTWGAYKTVPNRTKFIIIMPFVSF